MASIGVLGAGTWGMALARMLCNCGNDVTVWSAISSEIEELKNTHIQKNLPGTVIPEKINFTKELKNVCCEKELLLFAVPSIFV